MRITLLNRDKNDILIQDVDISDKEVEILSSLVYFLKNYSHGEFLVKKHQSVCEFSLTNKLRVDING